MTGAPPHVCSAHLRRSVMRSPSNSDHGTRNGLASAAATAAPDLGTSGRAAAMATAAATAGGGVPASDDRRTVSRVLHTPEAECNALPFELGTWGI